MSSSIQKAGNGPASSSNRRPSAGRGLANASNRRPSAVGSPATFRLSFGPVTSDTVAIDLTNFSSSVVKSFNIWCSEENEHIFSKGPVSSFLTDRPKRVFISKLRPRTTYTFRAVAYGDTAEVGYAQAMCLTKPVDTNHGISNPPGPSNFGMQIPIPEGNCSGAGVEQDCGRVEETVREMHPPPPTTRGRSLDLNHDISVTDLNEDDGPVANLNKDGGPPVPDLNKDAGPGPDLNKDAGPGPDLNKDAGPGPDLNKDAGPDLNKDAGPGPDLNKDAGPGPDLNKDAGPVPVLNVADDRPVVRHTVDANSMVVDKAPTGGFEGKFGECVKTIGRLERNGHLETEFGMKFLTWFTERSTLEQKQTVSIFIDALGGDEERLAKQLVDTYSDKINKRPKQ